MRRTDPVEPFGVLFGVVNADFGHRYPGAQAIDTRVVNQPGHRAEFKVDPFEQGDDFIFIGDVGL